MKRTLKVLAQGILLLAVAPGVHAAQCVVTTFGPLALSAGASNSDGQPQRNVVHGRSKRSAPSSLRVCMNNFQGSSEVPVAVQLYDVRDARVPLVEEVVSLLPGAGECISLRLAHRDRVRGVQTVFAAVSVEAESVDRTPVLTSAEPRGGVQFVGLLLPAVQSVREAGPDTSRPPPAPV